MKLLLVLPFADLVPASPPRTAKCLHTLAPGSTRAPVGAPAGHCPLAGERQDSVHDGLRKDMSAWVCVAAALPFSVGGRDSGARSGEGKGSLSSSSHAGAAGEVRAGRGWRGSDLSLAIRLIPFNCGPQKQVFQTAWGPGDSPTEVGGPGSVCSLGAQKPPEWTWRVEQRPGAR